MAITTISRLVVVAASDACVVLPPLPAVSFGCRRSRFFERRSNVQKALLVAVILVDLAATAVLVRAAGSANFSNPPDWDQVHADP